MKHRRAADLVKYRGDPLFERSKLFERALGELSDETRSAKLKDLKPDQRLLARATYFAKKWGMDRNVFGRLLERATNELRQVVVAPDRDRPIDDCILAWAQPEGSALFRSWWHDAIGKKVGAAYEGTKAVLIAVGGFGLTPHVRNVLNVVRHTTAFVALFTELARASPRALYAEGDPLVLREYKTMLKHVLKLSENFPLLAMESCVGIVKELAKLYPDAPIGQYVSIDGDFVAAWCQQRSSWDKKLKGHSPDLEDELRRRTPEAGYRMYTYTAEGIQYASDPGDLTPARGKALKQIGSGGRGYKLLVISEIVTGLPLVGILVDFSKLHEPDGLEVLLPLLYQLWPDIPLKAIVGDKLYDEHSAHEYCAVHYGVALVAVRKPSHKSRGGKKFGARKGDEAETAAKGEIKHDTIGRISGSGVAYCREHDLPMAFEGSEWPTRDGLAPGEPFSRTDREAHTKLFRSRWSSCAEGCRRASVATSVSWSALPYYPLTPLGRPNLYAMRIALQAARNTSESTFSSIEQGFKQALDSGVRTRLLDMRAVETLIWVAFTTRSLQMLADQRERLAELAAAA